MSLLGWHELLAQVGTQLRRVGLCHCDYHSLGDRGCLGITSALLTHRVILSHVPAVSQGPQPRLVTSGAVACVLWGA